MNGECWLEMDLYWFQGAPLDRKIDELFDRLGPIWRREPDARKGLTLCVGFLPESVLLWNGDPDDVIACCRPPTYERWTYRQLAEVVRAVRAGAEVRGLSNFHVGLIFWGGTGVPEGTPVKAKPPHGRTEEASQAAHYHHVGRWFHQHPEVRDPRFITYYYFAAEVNVGPEEKLVPSGKLSLAEYFARKWADLARYVGFDAVVFRDNVFSLEYHRGGEKTRYKNPEDTREWTRSLLAMLRRLKTAMPETIVIGYSSGGAAMEDWRSHGFDLEALARGGDMDLWITQTWGSAWQDYWPLHGMGITFQFASLLTQAAMLADTPCKHLFLVETFDAWEPWDAIHQYPSKVAWQVWAYSHATTLLPGGRVRRPEGFYSSWMNRGQQLLDRDAVEKVVSILNEASADLAKDPRPAGPCVVYHRAGLERLLDAPADYCRGESFDDWTSMLVKFGLPVLSVTRSEWLDDIGDVDALILPVPAAADRRCVESLMARLQQGTPVLFTGQAEVMSEPLRDALEIAVEPPTRARTASAATIEDAALAERLGTSGLVLRQSARSLGDSPDWRAIIRCLGGPVFARHERLPAWIWETPEWGTPDELNLSVRSVGSIETYAAVATSFSDAATVRWTNDKWWRPVAFLAWRYAAGGMGALLGNIETGVTGHSQQLVSGSLRADAKELRARVVAGPPPTVCESSSGAIRVVLAAHKFCVLDMDGSQE